MAFNAAVNTWLDSWSEDGTAITVPIASFPELTAAEADGTTGDIRKVLYAILEKVYAEWVERADADRPARMIINRGQSLDPVTGQINKQFTISFTLTPASIDVAAE